MFQEASEKLPASFAVALSMQILPAPEGLGRQSPNGGTAQHFTPPRTPFPLQVTVPAEPLTVLGTGGMCQVCHPPGATPRRVPGGQNTPMNVGTLGAGITSEHLCRRENGLGG